VLVVLLITLTEKLLGSVIYVELFNPLNTGVNVLPVETGIVAIILGQVCVVVGVIAGVGVGVEVGTGTQKPQLNKLPLSIDCNVCVGAFKTSLL
jgi:hypothetical protein